MKHEIPWKKYKNATNQCIDELEAQEETVQTDNLLLDISYALVNICRPRKNKKIIHLMPLLIGELNIHRGKPKYIPICALLDSGTSSSIVMGHFAAKATWNTKAGIFKTNKTCKVQFI